MGEKIRYSVLKEEELALDRSTDGLSVVAGVILGRHDDRYENSFCLFLLFLWKIGSKSLMRMKMEDTGSVR